MDIILTEIGSVPVPLQSDNIWYIIENVQTTRDGKYLIHAQVRKDKKDWVHVVVYVDLDGSTYVRYEPEYATLLARRQICKEYSQDYRLFDWDTILEDFERVFV